VISSAYQQILAVLGTTATGMRAKDICLALGVEPLPKHVEGARAKLKRLVTRVDRLSGNLAPVSQVGLAPPAGCSQFA
jgi:hypothetical protein